MWLFRAVTRKLGLALTSLATNKYFQMFANIPFVKSLFEKFSEKDAGADIEVTGFSGIITVSNRIGSSLFAFRHFLVEHSSTTERSNLVRTIQQFSFDFNRFS